MSQNTNAPKVDVAHIDALVASLTYETARVPNTTSTVATARLPGGFVAAIGHSACVAPENFDAELGRKYAIEDAQRQARGSLWSHEGYVLYQRLEQLRSYGIDLSLPPHQQRVLVEKAELDERLAKLSEFIADNPLFATLPDDEQERLRDQNLVMTQYSDILAERIAAFTKVSA